MHANDPTQHAATRDSASEYRRVHHEPPPDSGLEARRSAAGPADGDALGEGPSRGLASVPAPDTSVAVIVPAYNEADHVGEVLEEIPAYVDRIYAVDDASTDETWEKIRARVPEGRPDPGDGSAADGATESTADQPTADQPTDGRIVPIQHDENQGAGAALRTGYQAALDEGIDVTVTLDADGQMDPEQMASLVEPVAAGRADYAKGNRLAAEGREQMPPFRRLGNWLLTFLTKVASGYWDLMDPQNGYTAISGEALEAVDLEALPDGHDYPNDLLVRLQLADLSVADVTMPPVYGDEESTIDYVEFIPKTSTTLFSGFLWRLERTYVPDASRPRALFYGALVGVGATVGYAVGSDSGGESASERAAAREADHPAAPEADSPPPSASGPAPSWVPEARTPAETGSSAETGSMGASEADPAPSWVPEARTPPESEAAGATSETAGAASAPARTEPETGERGTDGSGVLQVRSLVSAVVGTLLVTLALRSDDRTDHGEGDRE